MPLGFSLLGAIPFWLFSLYQAPELEVEVIALHSAKIAPYTPSAYNKSLNV